MSGTISLPRGRKDAVWLTWATQRNNRRKTTRQIAELRRRMAQAEPADQPAIQAEIDELEARWR